MTQAHKKYQKSEGAGSGHNHVGRRGRGRAGGSERKVTRIRETDMVRIIIG